MKRHSVAILVALALVGIPGESQTQDKSATNKALADLQGVWKLTSIEHDGGTREFAERAPHWVVKGSKVFYGADELATISLDSATNPKCIDIDFRAPKAEREGVYTIRERTLKLCINWDADGAKERPQEFSTKDKSAFRLLTFEKVSVKEADLKTSGMGYVGIAIRKSKEDDGIYINDLLPDSPAKKSGLAKDDQLLQIAGVDVGNLPMTVQAIQRLQPGSELVIRVKRDGKEKDIKLKVGLVPFHFLVQ